MSKHNSTIPNKSILTGIMYILLVFSLSGCSAETPQAQGETAQEFRTPDSETEFAPGLPWLNVERPLTFDDMKGKVVILDFWTYGCINCIHVLADLKKLEEKYKDQLLVIGVHTPKFDNEKNIETLRSIVIRYDIHHPVVNDVNSRLGTEYGMRAWPTRVVIDPAGEVVGRVTGEGKYQLFDEAITKLLKKHEAVLDPKPLPIQLEKDRLASSMLAAPGKVAVSKDHVAISDTLNHRIIVTDLNGKIQQIFGGLNPGHMDGDTTSARFNAPQGLAFTQQGLYVADTGNHLIRYIDLSMATVRTVAGNGKLERYRKGEFDAFNVGLASPWGLAILDDQLYIAMAGSHQIWRYDTQSGRMGPYAGSGREGIKDGDAATATFSQPSGLSIEGDWLYVADSEDSAVRRIHLQQNQVETLVGTGLFDFGDRDGKLNRALLQHVLGIAAVAEDRLIITDTYNHKLKSINLQQGRVETLLGDGNPGNTLNGGTLTQLNEPGGLALLGSQVLIADTNNHRIVAYDLETGAAKRWLLKE